MTSEFTSLICNFPGRTVDIQKICNCDISHSLVEEAPFLDVITLNNEKRSAIENGFSKYYVDHHLVNVKNYRCRSFTLECEGRVTAANNFPSLPPFLFVIDPTNLYNPDRTRPGNVSNIYKPSKIVVSDTVPYTLHARVYSTIARGMHFFTLCFKLIDYNYYLVRIDNIKGKMVIVTLMTHYLIILKLKW
jgi:hypothetical protein